MNLVHRSTFETDYAELLLYFQDKTGSIVASKFAAGVRQTITLIQKHPFIGREWRNLRQRGIRSFSIPKFRNYLLFYEVSGNDLILRRLRYGGMDIPALF